MGFTQKSLNSPKLLCILLLLFVLILVRTAWITDDAYITFRTVDNFTNGNGLTWNTGERVQAYTNPLWMFTVTGLYLATGEIFFSVIILSIIISVFTAVLLCYQIAPTAREACVGLVLLISSKAYIDYSTSGLENPLTHLLAAVFFIILIKRKTSPHTLFLLSLTASLAAFNRMDTILLYVPALIYSLLKVKSLKGFGTMAAGFIPFVVWELFSLFYYGFPFPNSAYAKLGSGIPGTEFMKQGFFYFLNSIRIDPLTLMATTAAIILAIIWRKQPLFPMALGIVLYLVYVVRIGGDFMSGRFLAAPFFIAVAVITQFHLKTRRIFFFILFAAVLFGATWPYAPIKSGIDYSRTTFDEHGIADERGFYYRYAGLLLTFRGKKLPSLHRKAGESVRSEGGVLINHTIGYFGFFAGPKVHIIDPLGLADPLLSKMPSFYNKNWRIGHFARVIPAGYIQTLKTEKWLFEDKNLGEFYRKIRLITRSPLWSSHRIKEIIKMNLGVYRSLIDWELYRYPAGNKPQD